MTTPAEGDAGGTAAGTSGTSAPASPAPGVGADAGAAVQTDAAAAGAAVTTEAPKPDAGTGAAGAAGATTEKTAEVSADGAKPEKSLLGSVADAKEKPEGAAETPKPGEEGAKPTDGTEGAQPQPEAVAYDFKVPEGLQVDNAAMDQFKEILGANKISAELGQGLLDRHVAEMTRYAKSVQDHQQQTWKDTRASWRDQVKGDPEIGGSNLETALQGMAQARDLFVSATDMKAFNEMLEYTGVGDHPQMLKFMHNVAKKFGEPAPAKAAARPPADIGRPQGGRRSSVLYDKTPAKR